MNIPELQRSDMLLQTGTAQRTEAASSAVSPAVPQSPAQVIDEVETSILADIKALIARFDQDLDELVGGARAAGQGTGAVPYSVTEDAAPSAQQNGTSLLAPEAGQTTRQDGTAGMPQPDQPGASRTVLQGVFRVLLSKAQEFITVLTGTPSAAQTGEQPAAVSIESGTQGQQLPGGGDASGAQAPAGVIPGLSSTPESGARVQAGPAQIENNPDHPASTGMSTGIGRQAVPGDVVDAAARTEPAGVMAASVQATAETGITDQAPAGEADVLPGPAAAIHVDGARTETIVRPGPEQAKEIRASIDPASTSPLGRPAGQAEHTVLGGSDKSVPLYGRQAANSFSVAYGNDQNASPGNSSFQSQGVGPAAPVIVTPDPSAAVIADMITARVLRFVEEINAALSAGQDEAAAQGEGVYTGPEAEARQTSLTGGRTAHGVSGHAAVKQVFADVEGLQGARSIGISVEKDGFLHLDTRLLSSKLSSGKEETMAAARSFANAVSDKVDTLANVLAAAYMSYNRLPQMRAVRGSAETSSPEQEMTQEQGRLEQRLTELRLLIEKSEFLTKWLQGRVSDDAEFPEDEE